MSQKAHLNQKGLERELKHILADYWLIFTLNKANTNTSTTSP